MKKIFLLLIISLFISFNAYADTIILKSGKQIEGKILEKNEDSVKIDFAGNTLTYFLDELDSINGEKIKPAETIVNSIDKQESVARKETTASLPAYQETTDSTPAPEVDPKVARKILIIASIFIAIVYLYLSSCLYFIAQKISIEPAWLAWIPIGNIFLMCKIGSLPYWWVIIFLASSFIPTIAGLIARLGVFGFLWYKIAIARNKPGWLGALSAIPILGFIPMGIIAFSD